MLTILSSHYHKQSNFSLCQGTTLEVPCAGGYSVFGPGLSNADVAQTPAVVGSGGPSTPKESGNRLLHHHSSRLHAIQDTRRQKRPRLIETPQSLKNTIGCIQSLQVATYRPAPSVCDSATRNSVDLTELNLYAKFEVHGRSDKTTSLTALAPQPNSNQRPCPALQSHP